MSSSLDSYLQLWVHVALRFSAAHRSSRAHQSLEAGGRFNGRAGHWSPWFFEPFLIVVELLVLPPIGQISSGL